MTASDHKRIEPSLFGLLVALNKDLSLGMKPLRQPAGEVLVGTVNQTAGAKVPAAKKETKP